ncbi:MAG: PEP-CTERM sorting domain-containing protein [Planctomycetota bacterium]
MALSAMLLAGTASQAAPVVLADLTTDAGALPNGFTTGWFSGGLFDTAVDGGWDAGDYDWQMGQQLGTSGIASFAPGSVDRANFGNVAGKWQSSSNFIVFSRAVSPVEFTTAVGALTVFSLTFDELAVDQTATVSTDFSASNGGDIDYQVFLGASAIDPAVNVGVAAPAAPITSSSFTLSQGDTLYFVIDSNGSGGGDKRQLNITVSGEPVSTVIPEPGSLALTGLGTLLLIKRRRGR